MQATACRRATIRDIRDFYLGHQDSYRMIVNLDYGRQLNPPKSSLRSEPAGFRAAKSRWTAKTSISTAGITT